MSVKLRWLKVHLKNGWMMPQMATADIKIIQEIWVGKICLNNFATKLNNISTLFQDSLINLWIQLRGMTLIEGRGLKFKVLLIFQELSFKLFKWEVWRGMIQFSLWVASRLMATVLILLKSLIQNLDAFKCQIIHCPNQDLDSQLWEWNTVMKNKVS